MGLKRQFESLITMIFMLPPEYKYSFMPGSNVVMTESTEFLAFSAIWLIMSVLLNQSNMFNSSESLTLVIAALWGLDPWF